MFGRTKIYTVHIKPGMENAQARPVFVKEGFNLWAFFFTFLWALYKRLWIVAFLIIAFNSSLFFMLKHHALSPVSLGAIHAGLHVVIGCWGNDWMRAQLVRRGYIIADITAGDNLLRAEQRYFERMLAAA